MKVFITYTLSIFSGLLLLNSVSSSFLDKVGYLLISFPTPFIFSLCGFLWIFYPVHSFLI